MSQKIFSYQYKACNEHTFIETFYVTTSSEDRYCTNDSETASYIWSVRLEPSDDLTIALEQSATF